MKSSVFENLKPGLGLTALAIIVAISGCATTNPHARLETAQSEKELVVEKERQIAAEKDRVTAELTEARRSVRDFERERAAQTKAEREALKKAEAEGRIKALKLSRELCEAVPEAERKTAPDCTDFTQARQELADADLVNPQDFRVAGIPDYVVKTHRAPHIDIVLVREGDEAKVQIQGLMPEGWRVFTEGLIVEIAPKGKASVLLKATYSKRCVSIFEDGRQEACSVALTAPGKP